MSTITTLTDGMTALSFRTALNANFAALNTDKAEDSTVVHRAGSLTETITGLKTFTSMVSVIISGTGTTLTNPNIQAVQSVNNFTQIANQNKSNGANASADIIAYPDNNIDDTTGFSDIGITSSGFAQAAYAITTANDGYWFVSAVSGAGNLGNMVLCTDSTGTSNSIIFAVNGFTSLNKERMRIDGATGVVSFGYSNVASGSLKLYNSANLFASTIVNGTMAGNATITLPNATSTLATDNTAGTFSAVKTFSSAPIFNALPTGTAVASIATVSTLMSRDANGNSAVNSILEGFATTATATGTTTLTVASKAIQEFTGTLGQTIVLPVVSTLVLGQGFTIINNSTLPLTVNSSGGNFIFTVPAKGMGVVTCSLITGTTAASWDAMWYGNRTITVTQSATPAINTDTSDMFQITGLAQAITSMTTNLTGTPVNGQKIWIQITDNGTARAITWGTSFEASTIALPTTTVVSTRLDVYFTYNSVTAKWRCVGVA